VKTRSKSFLSGREPRHRVSARLALLGATAAVTLAAAAPATAAPVVVPPTGDVYNQLAVAWWQYVLARPTPANPLLDATGAHCADGQTGAVFFLVGTSRTDPVTRDCAVQGSHELFFPLINAFDVHTPGDGLDTPALVLTDFQSFHFRVRTLHASVDGVPIDGLGPTNSPFRACAEPVAGCSPASFSLTLPGNNLFGIPAGTYAPAVQDGFYLLLAPLAPGAHTITFGGTGSFQRAATNEDITYHLTVTG
jgi:hypothetical protein